MKKEEIIEFKETIGKNILPLVINMNIQQISDTISKVEKDNNLPKGFANMLMEQVLMMKEDHFNKQH